MPDLTRRQFIGRAATLAGGLAFGGDPVDALVARLGLRFSEGRAIAGPGEGGYGPLYPAGPELALPKGFTYTMFGVEGWPLSDGRPTPHAHDGMAAFALENGNIRLIRNHESRSFGQAICEPDNAYDIKGGGGTTSLEVEPGGARRVVREFISCGGTIVNCAGGPTPWDSWLTCEESTAGTESGLLRAHGYVFDVPVAAEQEVRAVPIKAMGRFEHEAIAIDPATWIVYQTEDRGASGFYRYIPFERGDLLGGGRLQILGIKDRPSYDSAVGQSIGVTLPVVWIDIEDRDPEDAGPNPSAVFAEAWGDGATRFARLEGCWYGNGSIYFSATSGGDLRLGQIWRYVPGIDEEDGGELSLLFESTSPDMLKRPDNVTVSPRGGIAICEDGPGDQHVRGLTPEGKIFDMARNILNQKEFAGACFSPDGKTLFVNIQGDTRAGGPGHLGMTFAIWGPWEEGAL